MYCQLNQKKKIVALQTVKYSPLGCKFSNQHELVILSKSKLQILRFNRARDRISFTHEEMTNIIYIKTKGGTQNPFRFNRLNFLGKTRKGES